MRKQKNTIKRIAAIVLCMVIAVTGLNTQTVSAASKKLPLKVTFNGKTASLVKDVREYSYSESDYPSIKSLETKWGKAKKSFYENGPTPDHKYPQYTWKKGKTKIAVCKYDAESKGIHYFAIEIKDKNGALCGVKVGTKKDTALKKFKNAFGIKKLKEGENMFTDGGNVFISLGIIGSSKGIQSNLNIKFKNDKVSSISLHNTHYF